MKNRCLYCYEPLESGQVDFHPHCAKAFFGSETAPELNFTFDEIAQLAKESVELSIAVPGVQPKLSLGWLQSELGKKEKTRLTILNALDGDYILKPPTENYPGMPENEHLSMKLAALFKINTVPASLIRLASGELCYITKRIDRNKDGSKEHLIDFLQILELDGKYKGSMEQLGKKIGELSVNTLFDKLRFFELTVFNYVIGNNDMHLKNFSMFLSKNGWVLSPAYDLLNVKLLLPQDKEDTALTIGGKKSNFKKPWFDNLGVSLGLNRKQVQSIYNRFSKWLPDAIALIDRSFLNEEHKMSYKELIKNRVEFLNEIH